MAAMQGGPLGGMAFVGALLVTPPLAFARKLTDAQIAAIANYVRTSWGNASPANATAEAVAKLRGSVR